MRRTINTRIEDNIFPNWRAHHSLHGWSSMNYPSALTNKKYLTGARKTEDKKYTGKFSNLKLPETGRPKTARRPISSEFEIKAFNMANEGGYAETFLSKVGRYHGLDYMKNYQNALEENHQMNLKEKFSSGMLTTYTYEEKKDIIKEMNKKSESTYALRPNSAVLGANVDPLHSRKVRQLDTIDFENDESDEDEKTYAYKV